MPEEIKLAMRVEPHPSVNANASWARLSLTSNNYRPGGFRLPGTSSVVADLLIELAEPIPGDIDGTPAGKIRITWATASTNTTSAFNATLFLSDVNPNADSTDFSTFDQNGTSQTDTSNGAGVDNEFDIAISGPQLLAGRGLVGVLRRSRTGADTLAADIIIRKVVFVANAA